MYYQRQNNKSSLLTVKDKELLYFAPSALPLSGVGVKRRAQ